MSLTLLADIVGAEPLRLECKSDVLADGQRRIE